MEITDLVTLIIDKGPVGLAVLVIYLVLRWKRADDQEYMTVLKLLGEQSNQRTEYLAGVLQENAKTMSELCTLVGVCALKIGERVPDKAPGGTL